jgi:hypothetical protein
MNNQHPKEDESWKAGAAVCSKMRHHFTHGRQLLTLTIVQLNTWKSLQCMTL